MSYHQDPAELLIYYLGLAGAPIHGDCAVEIREIVESIKQDAVNQAKKELGEEMAQLEKKIDDLAILVGAL